MIEMLTGAGLVLLGMAIGRVMRYRSIPRIRVIKPICGCDHHLSYHDEEGCKATIAEATKFNSYGEETAWKQVPCPCRKYVLKDDPMAGALGP